MKVACGLVIICCLSIADAFHMGFGNWNPFKMFDNFGFDFSKMKTYNLNDIPAGTKKVVRDGNGQGVVFRSKNGNSGGFTFSSGNGAGMAMGGTFGPDSKGDWVYSSSVDGQPGNVVFGSGRPFRRSRKQRGRKSKQNQGFMSDFFDTFFKIYNQNSGMQR